MTMELVNKGGLTYWIPMVEKDLSAINSYIRWEQAFWVYINIWAMVNPDRVSEILQCNHAIEVAATNFQWDNVYQYDREFRIQMGEHPDCNWGIILQQAWSLYMKNPLPQGSTQLYNPVAVNNNTGGNRDCDN